MFLPDDYYKPENEYCHKLSPTVDGHYRVVSVNTYMFILDFDDHHERISHDRVYWEHYPTQESMPTSFTGTDSTAISDPTAPAVFTAVRLLVLLKPHRGLSDLLDS